MNEIERRLENIERLLAMMTKTALTTEDVAVLLGVSAAHVRNLASAGELAHYRSGKRIYFKRSDIEDWQLQNRVASNAEINSEAATYLATHR